MVELPELKIINRGDVADWQFDAQVLFPDETITLDLRRWPHSELRPDDLAVIEGQLRSQRLLSNERPVIDQVREWARGPIMLGFVQ
jgi:hypothetical protein